MMQRLSTKILLLLLCAALLPPFAAAWARPGRLSGDALYGIGDYRAEVSGVESESLSSQYEQVSVRYEKENLIHDARLGRYTLMLGYEFNAIQPERVTNGVNDATISSISSDKLYYDATLLLAPGALPFRLTLFANDKRRSSFVTGSAATLPVGNQGAGGNPGHLLTPYLPLDLNNGTHRTLGGTLLVGIRNGSYLGAYRDLLSQLPRLLIDFKQTEGEDLHSRSNPQHYRDRNLAFVSLNKKDNWVHYRVYEYLDYLNPENNTNVSQAMLGTIDHLMQRQWINLTNWIKISGELSLIVEETYRTDHQETYTLNLMGIGKRERMMSTLFSHFSRVNDGRFISSTAELPMSITAELNRDTRIRTRLIYEATENERADGQPSVSTDPWLRTAAQNTSLRDLYLDSQLELLRSRPVLITPRLELEARSQGNTRDGLAVRLGAEVLSNRQLGKAFTWLGGYALTATRSNDEAQGASGSFIQNEIYGRVDKDLSRTLRVGANSKLTSGSGDKGTSIAFRIPTMSGGLSGGTETVDAGYTGRLTEGHISLYLDHRYQRLGNRLELSFDFFSTDNETSKQTSLLHVLNYQKTAHRFAWESRVLFGDDTESAKSTSFDYLGTTINGNDLSASWYSNLNYFYDPNRSAGLVLDGTISGEQNDSTTIAYKLSEKLFYRIFTTNGIIRRLAEFSEEIGYEKISESDNGRDNTLYGRFAAIYSPTKYLYGKLSSEIVGYLGSNTTQHTAAGEVGLDFEKFKVMASYSQANKDRESALLPEVSERSWDFKVKKIF